MLTATDIMAGKAVVQLGLTPLHAVRSTLRWLDQDPQAADLLQALEAAHGLTADATGQVRYLVELYERVWAEAIYLRQLERRFKLDPQVVARLIAEVEGARFTVRLGSGLVQTGQLSVEEDRALVERQNKQLTKDIERIADRYRGNDYEGVSRALVPGSADLDPDSIKISTLFRDEETRARVREIKPASNALGLVLDGIKIRPDGETAPVEEHAEEAVSTRPVSGMDIKSAGAPPPPPPPPPPPLDSAVFGQEIAKTVRFDPTLIAGPVDEEDDEDDDEPHFERTMILDGPAAVPEEEEEEEEEDDEPTFERTLVLDAPPSFQPPPKSEPEEEEEEEEEDPGFMDRTIVLDGIPADLMKPLKPTGRPGAPPATASPLPDPIADSHEASAPPPRAVPRTRRVDKGLAAKLRADNDTDDLAQAESRARAVLEALKQAVKDQEALVQTLGALAKDPAR